MPDKNQVFSAIAKEDIQAYLRNVTFLQATQRDFMGFLQLVKWTHVENRFEIINRSRVTVKKLYQDEKKREDRIRDDRLSIEQSKIDNELGGTKSAISASVTLSAFSRMSEGR